VSLENAFNLILKLHSREVTLERPGRSTIQIRMTPSNYFRNLSGIEEMVIEGREFVVSKRALGDFGHPKRGDRIIDPELGLSVVSEAREIFSLGGNIIGYRLRTS
jgi:hypothetical protein